MLTLKEQEEREKLAAALHYAEHPLDGLARHACWELNLPQREAIIPQILAAQEPCDAAMSLLKLMPQGEARNCSTEGQLCHFLVKAPTRIAFALAEQLPPESETACAFVSSLPAKAVTKPGQHFYFGHYAQKPILWRVLHVKGGTAAVISEYGLEARRFHDGDKYPTWAKSELRAWLNGDFLNDAFTEAERKALVPVRIVTPSAGKIGGGADTVDRLWVPSLAELRQYGEGLADDHPLPTPHAIENGAGESPAGGVCRWWTRSPGGSIRGVTVIASTDELLDFIGPDNKGTCVRPMCTLTLAKCAEP